MQGEGRELNELERARQTISAADRKLVEALSERFQAVAGVAAYKVRHGLPPVDAFRRSQVISDAMKFAPQCGGNLYLTRAVMQLVVGWMENQQRLLQDGEGAFASVLDSRSSGPCDPAGRRPEAVVIPVDTARP